MNTQFPSVPFVGCSRFAACCVLALLVGCSSESTDDGRGSGGTSAQGGAASGGVPAKGGQGNGGSPTTGGAPSTGGTAAVGGSAGGAGSSAGGMAGAGGGSAGSSAGSGGAAGGSGSGGAAGGSGGGAGASGGSAGSGGAAGGGGACPGGGKALAFNGTDGVVLATLGADIPLGNASRTIEMWIYTRATTWKGEVNTLFEYGNRTQARGVFGIDFAAYDSAAGGLQFFVGNGEYDYFFSPIPVLGSAAYVGWFHLAQTYDEPTRTLRSYVNGKEVAQGMRVLTSAQTLQTQSTDLNIGRTNNYPVPDGDGDAYFDGMIDEVRFWKVSRTAQQTLDSMKLRYSTPQTGLIGNWHFDEGSGTMTADASGGNHVGRLTGGVTWAASEVMLTCP